MASWWWRAAAILALAGSASLSRAHELSCEKLVGVAELDSLGQPRVVDGYPALSWPSVAESTPIDSYPAIIGYALRVKNLADEPSVLRSVEDSLDAIPSSRVVGTFGPALRRGVTLEAGGSARRVVLVRVDSYEDCLALGGVDAEARACTGGTESRTMLLDDFGSAECRARITCAPARVHAKRVKHRVPIVAVGQRRPESAKPRDPPPRSGDRAPSPTSKCDGRVAIFLRADSVAPYREVVLDLGAVTATAAKRVGVRDAFTGAVNVASGQSVRLAVLEVPFDTGRIDARLPILGGELDLIPFDGCTGPIRLHLDMALVNPTLCHAVIELDVWDSTTAAMTPEGVRPVLVPNYRVTYY
jgi:hypothetical protein